MGQNGYFGSAAGEYTLNKIPEAGLYEYIYKNDELLVKVDQYGVQTCQIDPPAGIALVKREKRELGSPIKFYFSCGEAVYEVFDIFKAKNFTVNFKPQKATYTLNFGEIETVAELLVPQNGRKLILKLTVKNASGEEKKIKAMPCVYPYVNELMMAPWDKPEWYTRTQYSAQGSAQYSGGEISVFTTTRYSVQGKKEDRRYFSMLTDLPISSAELSEDRLTYATKNFSRIPDALGKKTENEVYAFGQCFAGVAEICVSPHSEAAFGVVFTTALCEDEVESDIEKAKSYLSEQVRAEMEAESARRFKALFSVNTVKTRDKNFDKFVNEFLPLELEWVCALDRGWPTGMRGVRDASNDFSGYIGYDRQKCRDVIANIFAKQRSDGWYPRQVPFGNGEKFDLRHFVDSACFFTEYVYDYLAATDDYGVLEEKFGYYDAPEQKESGAEHLIKGIEYLTLSENIGEHGLVKMQGGDWLDCLSGAGQEGRGESVMVSCQLVMSLKYIAKIAEKIGKNGEKYLKFAEKMKKAINAAAYNGAGFYSGVFTDGGKWIFSERDPDGESRVYVPTNAYAIICGAAEGKERSVIQNIETLKTENGYKLFSVPFGGKRIDRIGKMGTGDFQPYFAENASVYNHGSQLFYVRALAEAGEYEKIYGVLNFAMPFNGELHREESVCAAPYAVTNCYHLVPSFYGRSGFSFLTGSVAMIERAVYQWAFGIRFTLDELEIRPCIPKEYADAEVAARYSDKTIAVKFKGFGNKIKAAKLNGKSLNLSCGIVKIDKMELNALKKIELEIELN